jgi:hypothetical protein
MIHPIDRHFGRVGFVLPKTPCRLLLLAAILAGLGSFCDFRHRANATLTQAIGPRPRIHQRLKKALRHDIPMNCIMGD